MLIRRAKWLVLTAVCSASADLAAAGMGEIRWYSTLNEPLNAEIDVLFVDPLMLHDYSVAIVPDQGYLESGAAMNAIVSGLRTELVAESGGRVKILLRSRGPVREPFLSFRVVLSAPDVRLLRDYNVLLDPPGMAGVEQWRAPFEPELKVSDFQPAVATQPVASEVEAAVARPVDLPNISDAATGQYGPTQPGDTLWAIASSVRRGQRVDIPQMVDLLYQANPHAFIRGDRDLLKLGVMLQIPALAEGAADNVAEVEMHFRSDAEVGVGTIGIGYHYDTIQHSADWRYLAPVSRWSESDLANIRNQVRTELGALRTRLLALKTGAEAEAPFAGTEAAVVAASELQQMEAVSIVSQEGPVATAGSAATDAALGPITIRRTPVSIQFFRRAAWIGAALLAAMALMGLMARYRRRRLMNEEISAYRGREQDTQRVQRTYFEATQVLPEPAPIQVPAESTSVPNAGGVDTVESEPIVGMITVGGPIDEQPAAMNEAEEDLFNEVDLYIAYGRHEKAKELIEAALAEKPDRYALKVRLAEVYYRTERLEEFNAIAEELKPMLEPEVWQKIEAMAKALQLIQKAPLQQQPAEQVQLDELIEIGGDTATEQFEVGDLEQDEIDYQEFDSKRAMK